MRNKVLLALGLLLGSGMSANAQVATPDVCLHHLRGGEYSSCRVVERDDEARCLCRYGIRDEVLTTGSISRRSTQGASVGGGTGQGLGDLQADPFTSPTPAALPGGTTAPSASGSPAVNEPGNTGGGAVPGNEASVSPVDSGTGGGSGPGTGATGGQNPGNAAPVGNAPTDGVTGNEPSGGQEGSSGNSADAGAAAR